MKNNSFEVEIVNIMQKHNVKGISLAIINDYEISYYETFGNCLNSDNSAINKNTLFQVASISKTVFATAIMILHENKILDIDENIGENISGWILEGKENSKISIRELLSHNSGINVEGFDGYRIGKSIPNTLDILEGKGNSEKILKKYDDYIYSGGGYTICQYIMEKIYENRTFEEIMKDLLFDKLEMANSQYIVDYTEELLKRFASSKYNIYPEYAAAGLFSTAYDIAKLGVDIQRSLLSDGILSVESAMEMLTRVNGNMHGVGFRISDDGRNFWHGGHNNEYKSHCIFSKNGKGIVILTNGNSDNIFDELELYIKDYYKWKDFNINSFIINKL